MATARRQCITSVLNNRSEPRARERPHTGSHDFYVVILNTFTTFEPKMEVAMSGNDIKLVM